MPHSGTLFIVATPIGNLEDVSARALRVLREVSVIAAEDTRRTGQLLARYGISTPQVSLHAHNETERAEVVMARLLSGESVALVSDAGTPLVSDPGQSLVARAAEGGIRVEPVPGPSAVLAALTASGLPAETFCFLGFPPTRQSDRAAWFARARHVRGTIVFYEAPHRIWETLTDWVRELGDTRLTVCRELTKLHEEITRGTAKSCLQHLGDPRGEYTVVGYLDEDAGTDAPSVPPDDVKLLTEFKALAAEGLNRRAAIARLARTHRMSAGDLYDAIERAKKSQAGSA